MTDGTILIVDDEKMIRDLLVAMLLESGQYRMLEAENGRDALQICQSEDVDLIFTDLKMPVMGGMELLAEMRRLKPEIPIVILTGFGPPRGCHRSAAAGGFQLPPEAPGGGAGRHRRLENPAHAAP